MNAPLPPMPHTDPADIDVRIVQAEQRLVARQARLRHGVTAFNRQLGEALQPCRLLRPALIASAAVALMLLLRRRAPRHAAAPGAVASAASAATRPAVFALLAALPWPRVVGLAWPHVPERWRRGVSLATVTDIVSLALPLLGSVFTPKPRAGGDRQRHG
jgi:apolipoprotein D and lipocalin family protein